MPRATIKPPQPPCDHEWLTWPETDGQEQRCTKCKAFRRAPRCSNCGTWLSTRYSGAQPHKCDPEDVLDRKQGREDRARMARIMSYGEALAKPDRPHVACICHEHKPTCDCRDVKVLRVQADEHLGRAMANMLEGPTLRGRLEPGWTPPRSRPLPEPAQNNPDGYPDERAAGQAPTKPTHALKTVGWPYAAPPPQSAPAPALSAPRAFLAGWLGGVATTVLVAVLVSLLT